MIYTHDLQRKKRHSLMFKIGYVNPKTIKDVWCNFYVLICTHEVKSVTNFIIQLIIFSLKLLYLLTGYLSPERNVCNWRQHSKGHRRQTHRTPFSDSPVHAWETCDLPDSSRCACLQIRCSRFVVSTNRSSPSRDLWFLEVSQVCAWKRLYSIN